MPDFAAPNVPRVLLFATAIGLLWIFTGWLKRLPVWREGDIRKVNHIAAFAGGAMLFGWLPEPTARGSLYAVSILLLAMVAAACRLKYHTLPGLAFAANTRESDTPHQAYFFWSSWLVSVLGMLAIDLLFGNMNVTRTAALIVGIADGVAEPVGRRFGRHCFTSWKTAKRSAEGSAAVFAGTFGVMVFAEPKGYYPLAAAGLMAVAVTLVEALSPKGTDNLTIPLAASVLLDSLMRAGWIA